MQDLSQWVVAIIVAVGGIGLSFFFQGWLLLKPQDKKKAGWWLVVLGSIYLLLAVIGIISWLKMC